MKHAGADVGAEPRRFRIPFEKPAVAGGLFFTHDGAADSYKITTAAQVFSPMCTAALSRANGGCPVLVEFGQPAGPTGRFTVKEARMAA